MIQRTMDLKETASTTRRREAMRATLKARLQAWAGFGVIVLSFVASLAYVVYGGTLAPEPASVSEAQPSTAALAIDLANAGDAVHTQIVSVQPGRAEQ